MTQNAKIKKWVPRYTKPGVPDLFYINQILSAMWSEPDGSLPRLGNPDDPLDDLVYVMLTRRGHIEPAQAAFESIRSKFTPRGQEKPDWAAFIDQGIGAMARELECRGLGRTRVRGIHAALGEIRRRFGCVTLDRLRRWNNTRCLEFLRSLPGVSLKTAACVMLCPVRRLCASFRRRASEQWRKDQKQPSCVDLFAGAGGTSPGLSRPIK